MSTQTDGETEYEMNCNEVCSLPSEQLAKLKFHCAWSFKKKVVDDPNFLSKVITMMNHDNIASMWSTSHCWLVFTWYWSNCAQRNTQCQNVEIFVEHTYTESVPCGLTTTKIYWYFQIAERKEMQTAWNVGINDWVLHYETELHIPYYLWGIF